MKVAIVHDWLYGGGAERVVYELHQLFPDAPIYTSYCSDDWRQKLDGKVVTGYLQKWPFNKLRKFLPVLRIQWFGHLDFTGYDLVISSSGNGEAMGIKVPKGTTHVSYCHTPTHYYWRHYNQYMQHPGFGALDPLVRFALKILVRPLRKWDCKAAQRPDYLIANSTGIQADIKTYYHRDSVVIQPPVDVARFAEAPEPHKRRGYVVASRQVPMKRIDVIVRACVQLNVPLKVIGRGPDHDRLVKLSGPTITFMTTVTDEEMAVELASAKAFLFASHEDFGITPVEAMAAGTPVIAYKAGGALDYVHEGVSGAFFTEQTVASLVAAIQSTENMHFDHDAIRRQAQAFAPGVFRQKMTDFLANIRQ
jgi:glycosyltransferase involved in cell wall biosynthesis